MWRNWGKQKIQNESGERYVSKWARKSSEWRESREKRFWIKMEWERMTSRKKSPRWKRRERDKKNGYRMHREERLNSGWKEL